MILRDVNLHANVGIATLHGRHFGMELLQPHHHLLLSVVAPLLKARQDGLFVRGQKNHVINLTRVGIRTPSDDALHYHGFRHFDEEEAVGGYAGQGQSFGLGPGERKSDQQLSLRMSVVLVETVLDLL